MLAGSVRTFSSEDKGDKAKVVEKESEKKKQLKSDDLLRILSLAKPEYKSLAGTCKFVLFFPMESLKCVTWLVEKLIILNVFSGWILRIAFNKSELNGSHLEWSFSWRQSWIKEKLNYKLTFTQVAKTSSTKINLL